MFVVIFRAKVRQTDNEYSQVAARMRELALGQFGCLEFTAVTEGSDE
ncbi:MAG: antibiotic biosynthesis monooxygenase, partial [Rhodoferax sp.]|nr:antibiotic biosynthesis monooxygenase [Rhodoferax sp.]NCS61523.1 antibiotic biosynthesis monooxygenase [Rhodoferax sp.]